MQTLVAATQIAKLLAHSEVAEQKWSFFAELYGSKLTNDIQQMNSQVAWRHLVQDSMNRYAPVPEVRPALLQTEPATDHMDWLVLPNRQGQ